MPWLTAGARHVGFFVSDNMLMDLQIPCSLITRESEVVGIFQAAHTSDKV